jgi:hypothetical protein
MKFVWRCVELRLRLVVGRQVEKRQVLGYKAQELHTLLVVCFDDLIVLSQ